MSSDSQAPYDIEIFYDGGCPLCLREINFLRRRDRRELIRFTNIADPDFQPATVGKSFDELMAKMHGRLPDGTLISGVEVFRRMYAAIGFGPLVRVSRWPIVSQVLDLGYVMFARNRLRLTGRCNANSCSVTQDAKSEIRNRNST